MDAGRPNRDSAGPTPGDAAGDDGMDFDRGRATLQALPVRTTVMGSRLRRSVGWGVGLVTAIAALACAPTVGGGGSEDAGEDAGEHASGSEGGAASSSSDDDGGAGGTIMPLDTSTGEVAAECGNGVVEGSEQCDGGLGCVDCEQTCGVGGPVDLLLTGYSWTTSLTPALAVADGSGDILVTSAAGLHRVDPGGQQRWVQSESPTTYRVFKMARADAESVWIGWLLGTDPQQAKYSRHAVADGSELESFAIDATESNPGALLGTPDGELFVSTHVALAGGEWRSRVERRTPIGAALSWSSELVDDTPDDTPQLFVHALDRGHDGGLFAGADDRLDFETVDGVVLRLDAQGVETWRTQLDFPGKFAGARPLRALADGGVVVTARRQFNSTGAVGNTPAVFTRLVRLDRDGELVWDIDPSDAVEDGRLQVMDVQVHGDGFAVAGAVVDDHGSAAAWLGYLDAHGELGCSASMQHPNGDATTIDAFFTDAEGAWMVQGYTDDATLDQVSTARWVAPVFPY